MGHPNFGRLEICVCRQRKISDQVREKLFALSQLSELANLTFDNFDIHGNKERKLTQTEANSLYAAKEIAQNFIHSISNGKWIIFIGKYGCGKTHLAAAIANEVVSLGVPTLFLTVPDLLDSLRFSFDSENTTFEERFNEIRNASLLVLDDFGTQNMTPWSQEKLFQIINYRYINRLSTIITTNLSLDDVDERILSRLQDTNLVQKVLMNAPDFRRPQHHSGVVKLSSLEHLSDKLLNNFSLRKNEGLSVEESKNLEKIWSASNKYANEPNGWLVFTGPYGCGKTHLAAGIANHRLEIGDSPLFIMVPDLLDHLRATFDPHVNASFDHRFEEIRTARLLILDDLGTQSMTPWAREKLYQLFNHRYNAKLPTVITTSDSIEEMDARIRSRLLDRSLCTIYAITVPSFHGGKAKKTRK